MDGGGLTEPGATVIAQRSVLLVARTITTSSRLFDVLDAITHGPVVTVFWTIDGGSRFGGELRSQLKRRGVRLISWAKAVRRRFDMVVAAHAGASLRKLDGSLVVLQHGTGFGRRVLWRTGDQSAPVGISPRELMYGGEVVPDHIGVSDECLVEQVRAVCPEAVDRLFVMGDPTWDRILHNRDAWREKVREEWGVRPGQRVVLVSSTWNTTSLLGRETDLIDRLLAQLPVDEYKVVLVVHPNVWALHGRHDLMRWLREARAGGLLVVKPCSDWHAALVLADVAVGDHGSVSVYTAALGVPFFLVGSGKDELVEDSTTLRFVRAARRLDVGGDLRAQLAEALAAPADPEVVAAARLPLLRHEGMALEHLNAKFCEIMGLPRGKHPKPEPYAVELIEARPCTAYHVVTATRGGHRGRREVVVERFPAVEAAHRAPDDAGERVLVAEDIEADMAIKESAEIVLCSTRKQVDDGIAWTSRAHGTSASLAGVACGGGYVFRLRAGPTWRLRISPCGRDDLRWLMPVVGGALHRGLLADAVDDHVDLTVCLAGRKLRLRGRRLKN